MNFLLLQVIAFSDEEGVRFQSTFLGSAAVAGILPVTALQISDKRFLSNSKLISIHDVVRYHYIHV
jgi:hypothetical protein